MLKGKYVNLRPLEEDDLETLKAWRNSKNVRKTTREYNLLNMINQRKWFESIHKNKPPTDIMFGVTNRRDKLIGVTGLTYIDWKNGHAEISIYLSMKNWQTTKEVKDTINLIIKYGFGELNLHRLWVEIFAISGENVQLFKRMNFLKEATLRDKLWRDGRWWQSYIYSILSSEYNYAKEY